MKRSLEEKYQYHTKKSEVSFTNLVFGNYKEQPFSEGYVHGIDMYRMYPKMTAERKKEFKEYLDQEKVKARKGNAFSKGLICAVRDASQERKSKYRR